METTAFVAGLMKQNSNALGFIPTTRLYKYEADGQIIVQRDTRGREAGYLIHGKPVAGQTLSIAQAVIEYDRRNHGFGELAVLSLFYRARQSNCAAIKLRCADDLAANAFWQSLGFEMTGVLRPMNKRQRAINVYTLQLWPLLPGLR
jgi:GNAT superfamily N-acetyltransferase